MLEQTAQGAAAGSTFGPWGSVIGAGIGAAASLIGGNKQNSANQAMAQAQMAFQERMRATQYQTAVADIKAAGLNPMLAYSQGGAGTPQGATAQMGNPLGDAGNSAREAAMAVANYKQIQTQNVLTEHQAEKAAADTNLANDQATYTRANTAREIAQMPGYGKYGQLRDAQIEQLTTSSALQAAQQKQALAQTGYLGAQTGYTGELTRLAKRGSAPSSQRPLFQDLKGMAHGTYEAYKQHPNAFQPFGKLK
jgi:hypothetical protein